MYMCHTSYSNLFLVSARGLGSCGVCACQVCVCSAISGRGRREGREGAGIKAGCLAGSVNCGTERERGREREAKSRPRFGACECI